MHKENSTDFWQLSCFVCFLYYDLLPKFVHKSHKTSREYPDEIRHVNEYGEQISAVYNLLSDLMATLYMSVAAHIRRKCILKYR